ncbi:hypothetical protein BDV97DRAFT_301677 [Delphinella strobiligena]|nr:hypothetical protein BDV97DRAFT_301677 [Delphinella strobiligena]
MAFTATYHEDSDPDDEPFASPTFPSEGFSASSDSDMTSPEHTPTTFTHSQSANGSPTGLLTQWTAHQCADWISVLGLSQYAALFIDESVNGEALAEMQNQDFKEMGITSIGHRLTLLKAVYEVKVKQNIPLDNEHYVPLSAEGNIYDMAATQDDITRVIESIRLRDQRILQAEYEMRLLKEDFNRLFEENRKLREDTLPVIRMAKDRLQPLPTPNMEQPATTPTPTPPADVKPEKLGSNLSRKFSTKKLFLSSAPKNPSPTIHEGTSLDPSAAAMAASSHLMSSQPSPNQMPQHSPTSPAYGQQASSAGNRSFPREAPLPNARQNYDDHHTYSGYAPSTSTLARGPSRREPPPTSQPLEDAPLSATIPPNTSVAPSITTTAAPATKDRGESNPQVEIFKSFRVSIEDPCHKVLPVALKRYQISDDWRQYALYIVYGDQERCLGLEEKPLLLFKQLDREGKKPMFMLRKHASPPGHEGFTGGFHRGENGVGAGSGQTVMRGEDGRPLPGGVL